MLKSSARTLVRGSRNPWRMRATVSLVLIACSFTSSRADVFGAGAIAYARRDYARSAAIFMREAVLGQPEAQTYLGYMYANGRGVPQDFVVAAQWLRRAADQGFPAAQFLLGLMVDKGQGVKQDFVEAEFWLNLAASHAEPRDRAYWTRIRDSVASKLTLDELALSQRLAVEWQPIAIR
jgi:TPR repeat protein